jgi:transcriptional regulator with XRE-family HTH domain
MSLGIKQADLARQLGFSRQFMRQIESGEAAVPKEALLKCIVILQIPHHKLKLVYRITSQSEVDALIEAAESTKLEMASSSGSSQAEGSCG